MIKAGWFLCILAMHLLMGLDVILSAIFGGERYSPPFPSMKGKKA